MKNLMNFVMIAMLTIMVVFSCDNNPTEPAVEELPIIQFTTSNSGGAETVAQVQLEVSLSEKSDADVSSSYTIIGGTASVDDNDYNLSSGVVTITAGEVNTSIVITVIDDEVEEGDETIIVALSNPINATLGDQFWHTYTESVH